MKEFCKIYHGYNIDIKTFASVVSPPTTSKSLSDDNFKALVQYIKDKNFTEMRKWVGLNSDNDSTSIFRLIYDNSSTYLKPNSIPQLVLILADYQHKAAFVADQEINLVACLTEMMAELEWK